MDNTLRKIICRTCLSEASSYKPLTSKMVGEHRTVREVLSNVINMDVSVNDKYPKQVCDECHAMIIKADEFKKRCVQSEMILKNGFLSHTFEELIKHEIISSDQTNSQNMSSSFLDNCLKKDDIETAEIELQLVDNFLDSDCLKSDINYVKEEQDDFLQDDMNDLTDSNMIEISPVKECTKKLNFSNNKPSVCGLAIGNTKLKKHTKKCVPLTAKTDLNTTDSNKNLICTVCHEEFNNLELFQMHIPKHGIKIDFDTTNYQNFACVPSLNNHMKTNQLNARYKQRKQTKNRLEHLKNGVLLTLLCPICTEKFPNYEMFQLHLKTHKLIDEPKLKITNSQDASNKEQFQCSICMRKFVHKTSLVAHLKRHEDKAQIKFTCKTCKREFQHKAHLENHVVLVHSKETGFTCDVCSRSFSSQESLDSHKEGHKVDRKHECKVCGKSFTMLSTLTEHIKIHTGEKPYLCSVCGRGFSQKNNMTQHMRRHQGVKPFKCDTCERRFVSKGELEAHTRKHSGAHPFVCDDCGGSFTTSSSLTKHRRIHTGERPYACDLCTLRFTVLNTLKNHRRTHTGEKPYQCSYCEKAFTQRSDLVAHIRCHTGERPYICTSCGQAFRKASALKVHVKVHGKDPMVI